MLRTTTPFVIPPPSNPYVFFIFLFSEAELARQQAANSFELSSPHRNYSYNHLDARIGPHENGNIAVI